MDGGDSTLHQAHNVGTTDDIRGNSLPRPATMTLPKAKRRSLFQRQKTTPLTYLNGFITKIYPVTVNIQNPILLSTLSASLCE